MKKQKLIFSSMFVLLLMGLALLLVPKAKAEISTVFEQNFDSCELVSGSGNVFGVSGGFAGASDGLEIVEQGIEGKSLKVSHTFFDNGWQQEAFYKDNLTMASADNYYSLYFELKVVGNISYIYFKGLKGAEGTQIEFNVANGTFLAQGDAGLNVNYAKVGDVYRVEATWQGNGGKDKVFFFTNVCSTTPTASDPGYYLIDNFKFTTSNAPISMNYLEAPTTGYTKLWATDFNDADPTTSGSDAMYHVNGFAGPQGLCFDATGFNGSQALKGTLSFYDNGWQVNSIYETAYLWGSAWDNVYRLSFSFKPFGQIDCGDIYLRFDGNQPYPYSAIMRYEVASGKIAFTSVDTNDVLGMDYSHVNGVWTVNIYMRGCDGGYFIEYLAHTGTPASANENADSGLLIDDFSLYQCDNYELDRLDEKVLFAENFDNTNSSITGSDAMYAANGFAGPAGLSIEENGISGKSLKVVHTFWPVNPDGGWQKDSMYQTSRLGGTISAGLYELSCDIKLTGCVSQGDFKVLANDAVTGSITLRMDGTYTINSAECNDTVMKEILVKYNATTQVFHISYKFNGSNGSLMFIDYMCTTDDTDTNTGFLLDNFKLARVRKLSASENVMGTYEAFFEQDFNSLTAGTTYATSDALYNAIGFGGPNDTANTVREIIADGIHGNSLKITYDFYDNNCSQGALYVDVNKAHINNTSKYSIYKFECSIKPFGDVDTYIYKNVGGWLSINIVSGATDNPTGVTSFITSNVTKNGDVYHYEAYFYGSGGALTDTFEVHIIPSSTTPTGLIIDDYKISLKVSNTVQTEPEEPPVVDYTPTISNSTYDLGSNANVAFTVNLKGQALTEVKIGDRTLQDSEYSVSGSTLTVNYQVIEEFDPGKYAVKITTVEEATAELLVTNINIQVSGDYQERYTENFDELDAKNYTGDELFHACGFAGVNTTVVEDCINGKSLKAIYSFYDNGWQNGYLYIDSSKTRATDLNNVYKISFKIKPIGPYAMIAFGIQFDDAVANPNAVIYLKADGTTTADDNALLIKYDATLEGGVWTLNAYYKTAGYYLFNFFHMQTTDVNTETGFYLDDYSFSTVKSPTIVGENTTLYDIVTMSLPEFELDLAGFGVQNVKVGGALLVKDTDYTLTTMDNGHTKLTLTKAYMDALNVGDTVNMTIRTTKATYLNASVTVVNAVPVITEKTFTYQLDSNKNVELTVDLKDVALTSVSINETALDASSYTLSGNKLAINASVFEALAVGNYTLTVKTGDTASISFKVSDADRTIKGSYSPVYSQNFDGLTPGKYSGESLYQACGFAGVNTDEQVHEITEEGYLKSTYSFYPVSLGGWQREMLYLNSGRTQARDTSLIYKVSFTASGFGAWKQVCLGIQLADSGITNNWLHLYKDGTWAEENYNDYLVKAEVTYENDAFNVTVYYRSAGNYIFCFWNMETGDDETPTGLLLDNFVFSQMNVPQMVSENGTYDTAVAKNPYYLIDLFEYEIESVMVGETALTKGTDYTTEAVFESTRIRFELTNAYIAAKAVGTTETIKVKTSKGNTIELPFSVVNTTPTVPAESNVDLAENTNLQLTVDLMGKTLDSISLNGEDLAGNEYTINSDNTVLTFKKEYLAKLTVGANVFTLKTSSGATKAFTINVSNSTPTISNAEFQKGSTADVEFTVELNNKDITKVMVDETELQSTAYSYANGKLTIAASAFEALTVGNHTVTLVTLGQATATVEVKDVNPEISGTYAPKMGEALQITIDCHNRPITQVKVDDFVLLEDEYTLANGVLTISADVLEELSVGTHTVTVTTAGGSAQVSINLQEADPVTPGTQAPATQAPATQAPSTQAPATQAPATQAPSETGKKKGCKSFVESLPIFALLLVPAAVVVIKRKRDE